MADKPRRLVRVRLRYPDTRHYAGVEPNPLQAGSMGRVVAVRACGTVDVCWDSTGATTDHDPDDLDVIRADLLL